MTVESQRSFLFYHFLCKICLLIFNYRAIIIYDAGAEERSGSCQRKTYMKTLERATTGYRVALRLISATEKDACVETVAVYVLAIDFIDAKARQCVAVRRGKGSTPLPAEGKRRSEKLRNQDGSFEQTVAVLRNARAFYNTLLAVSGSSRCYFTLGTV